MPKAIVRLATAFVIGLTPAPWNTAAAIAQSYPIDCAILLCLSGGWPASVPCMRARTEFIRRITPWPIEPPLQIWRCPMGASYKSEPTQGPAARLHNIRLRQPAPVQEVKEPQDTIWKLAKLLEAVKSDDSRDAHDRSSAWHLAQAADIDISGPQFDFVRSIRVFNVRQADQYDSGHKGGCIRTASVLVGRYGDQGEFAWHRTDLQALPDAHIGLENWGLDCPDVYHRSVFVDWRDFTGNYGYEQVDY